VRELLEKLENFGNKDTTTLSAPGVREARRLGFVTSRRVGPPALFKRPVRARKRSDYRKLAWRHELTDAGRAALARELPGQ
jgi:hypothetical protein